MPGRLVAHPPRTRTVHQVAARPERGPARTLTHDELVELGSTLGSPPPSRVRSSTFMPPVPGTALEALPVWLVARLRTVNTLPAAALVRSDLLAAGADGRLGPAETELLHALVGLRDTQLFAAVRSVVARLESRI